MRFNLSFPSRQVKHAKGGSAYRSKSLERRKLSFVFERTFVVSSLYSARTVEKYFSRNSFCCGLIGLFALLLWGQTVSYDFVWDDQIYITQNKSIRSLANIPQIFSRQEAQSAENPSISYRPLRNTVYAILTALGGEAIPKAWIFHLASVLWHTTASILLFLVALLLCERLVGGISTIARMLSLFVALGFAAHPVNSEAICWAKCMDDLMAGAFVLASMRSLLKWSTSWRDYVLALVWFLLAVFSKESSVPFALVVVLILTGFHKFSWKRSLALSVPFFFVGLLFAICQRLVMGRTTQCPPLSGSYAQTLIDMLPVGADYARLLFGIPPFCADYNFMVGAPPHPILSGAVLGGLYLLIFVAAMSFWLWRRETWRLSSFGLIWIAVFLLPVSNLVPMMQYMAERFLYLPLIGFLLALGGVMLNFSRQRVALTASATILIILWTTTSVNRMGIWRDELALFIGTELEHPGIKRIEKNAVGAVLRLPQIQAGRAAKTLSPAEAEPILATLQRARLIYPENDLLTTQLGIFELKLGRTREAIWLLELAARQNPDAPERWYNLATTYHLIGDSVKAREACDHALRLNPQYPDALHLQSELEYNLQPSKAAESVQGR
ncbi:MAG TPA: tetratricopeptide repeat protein [Verrucomicrobiae bacterium]